MPPKLTTDIFIQRSKAKHGNGKYDYTECVYVDSSTKVKLTCQQGHSFETRAPDHFRGVGCPYCAPNKKSDTTAFIAKAVERHGTTFDYTLTHYTTKKSDIIITCPIHGAFTTTPGEHLRSEYGCYRCGSSAGALALTDTTGEFIGKARQVHGDRYDYSAVVYINCMTNVDIRCVVHNHWFNVQPNAHLRMGVGCTKCTSTYRRCTEEFIDDARKVHGDEYNYDNAIYNSALAPITITCKQHGDFETSPSNHLNGHRCPLCTTWKYSKISIEWLTSISDSIEHAENGGEFKIPGVGSVDGYCEETNTVYEYHGDYWHGHPSKYNPNDIHPINKKTYGELYQKTLARDQKIRDMGYNLIVTWEHEFKLQKVNDEWYTNRLPCI